jgi:hypothetical protein
VPTDYTKYFFSINLIFQRSKKVQAYWDEQIEMMTHQRHQKDDEKNLRKYHIMERIDEQEKKAQIRTQANKVSRRIVKDLLANSPDKHYHERKYQMEVLLPEAQRVQEIQLEKKSAYRPIRLPEIAEHAAMHEERLKILQEVREVTKPKKGRRPISNYKSANFNNLQAREDVFFCSKKI